MKFWKNNGRHLFTPTDLWAQLNGLANEKIDRIFKHTRNGDLYATALERLPDLTPTNSDLDQDAVTIGNKKDIDFYQETQFQQALRQLMPWRKGPFHLFGTMIDSEWNSSIKWNRLKNNILPLTGKRILDIGSSNGYYMFRMSAAQPELILGIEPYPLFFTQFLLLQHYAKIKNIFCIPAKLEDMNFFRSFFDTVFCMGILYHQRSPLDALSLIHALMKKGGELVLETLILSGNKDHALFPAKRYAKMNNVYFIPTTICLFHWLRRTGFHDIKCISVEKTTSNEQRKTDWIASQSLDAFLDPENPDLTIEGYPAPTRAIILAKAK